MFGYYLTNQTPFKHVYLHGLIRDNKGQKMSKSKGNVINPLEIVKKYSADSLRMALIIRSTPGIDKSVSEQDFKAMRNFTNKIWNASRFLITSQPSPTPDEQKPADQDFYLHLRAVVAEVTKQLNDLKVGLAADRIYDEFWHWFCDQCIEQAKKGELSQSALLEGLETFLKLLHPLVPFVTQAVWEQLPNHQANKQSLSVSSWPK